MNQKNNDRVFDLIDMHNLRSLGMVENQLLGPIGKLTLETMKANAMRLGYDHCPYRDHILPGVMWVENLRSAERQQWRSLEGAKLVEKLCPGLIAAWDRSTKDPLDWEMIYPALNTPALQYCTALEWLVIRFPDAVVAWVELALTYENELKITYALPELYKQCRKSSSVWGVVGHVLGLDLEENTAIFRNQSDLMSERPRL